MGLGLVIKMSVIFDKIIHRVISYCNTLQAFKMSKRKYEIPSDKAKEIDVSVAPIQFNAMLLDRFNNDL